MPGRRARNLVRVFVGTDLGAALATCAVAPIPADLPAVAFGQTGLYRLEVALLVFYGCLLLITPAFSGLIRGRLPIEISTRGAKFAEEADQSAEMNEAKIKELERTASALTEGLATARFEIERLEMTRDDSRQPTVDSRR